MRALVAPGAATLAATLATALAGCGGVRPADLFIVERSGATPQAHLTLLVDEQGGVHCNGAPAQLDDARIVQARGIQEDLRSYASRRLSLAPQPGSVLSYQLRDADGTVRFSDNSLGQPKVLRELALFVLRTGQQVCHLPE